MTTSSNDVQVIGTKPALDKAAVNVAVQDDVKRVMGAFTRLLVGKKGNPRGRAFNNNVSIIVGAPLSPTTGLLWLADLARVNGRHFLHLSEQIDCNIPTVVLAYCRGEVVNVYEHCMLCLRLARIAS